MREKAHWVTQEGMWGDIGTAHGTMWDGTWGKILKIQQKAVSHIVKPFRSSKKMEENKDIIPQITERFVASRRNTEGSSQR